MLFFDCILNNSVASLFVSHISIDVIYGHWPVSHALFVFFLLPLSIASPCLGKLIRLIEFNLSDHTHKNRGIMCNNIFAYFNAPKLISPQFSIVCMVSTLLTEWGLLLSS